MMSRAQYKGLRIEYYPDECAAPLPRPTFKSRTPTPVTTSKPMPAANIYALLDDGSNQESDSESGSYMTEGIRIDPHQWADATVA